MYLNKKLQLVSYATYLARWFLKKHRYDYVHVNSHILTAYRNWRRQRESRLPRYGSKTQIWPRSRSECASSCFQRCSNGRAPTQCRQDTLQRATGDTFQSRHDTQIIHLHRWAATGSIPRLDDNYTFTFAHSNHLTTRTEEFNYRRLFRFGNRKKVAMINVTSLFEVSVFTD